MLIVSKRLLGTFLVRRLRTTQPVVPLLTESDSAMISSTQVPSANTGRRSAGKKGGKAGSYEDWTKQDLQKRAAEIGIEGRSKMSKSELVNALRNH